MLSNWNSPGLLSGKELTLYQTSPGFYVSAVEVFWKHCGKGEKLLVTKLLILFSTLLEKSRPFSSNLKLSSANSFNLEESKISRLEKS